MSTLTTGPCQFDFWLEGEAFGGAENQRRKQKAIINDQDWKESEVDLGSGLEWKLWIRPATVRDLPGLIKIQSLAYSEHYQEPEESFASHLQARGNFNALLLAKPYRRSRDTHIKAVFSHGETAGKDESEDGTVVVGYALGHPWWSGIGIPTLGAKMPKDWLDAETSLRFTRSSKKLPDIVYVHDIAVAPQFRGKRLSGHLMQYVLDWGRQLREIDTPCKRATLSTKFQAKDLVHFNSAMLVAVQGAAPLWAKSGFQEVAIEDTVSRMGVQGEMETEDQWRQRAQVMLQSYLADGEYNNGVVTSELVLTAPIVMIKKL